MARNLRNGILSWLIIAAGVWLAQEIIPGIEAQSTASMLLVAALVGLLNAVLRPVLVFLALPFVVLTLGLGILIINAATFGLAGWLTPGFDVEGFWPAMGGALIISLLSLLLHSILKTPRAQGQEGTRIGGGAKRIGRGKRGDDDVIDV